MFSLLMQQHEFLLYLQHGRNRSRAAATRPFPHFAIIIIMEMDFFSSYAIWENNFQHMLNYPHLLFPMHAIWHFLHNNQMAIRNKLCAFVFLLARWLTRQWKKLHAWSTWGVEWEQNLMSRNGNVLISQPIVILLLFISPNIAS